MSESLPPAPARRSRVRAIALRSLEAVAGFAAAPFLATWMFRLFDTIPDWLPLVVSWSLAGALWVLRRRAFAIGLAAGAVTHLALLYWLFGRWEGLQDL